MSRTIRLCGGLFCGVLTIGCGSKTAPPPQEPPRPVKVRAVQEHTGAARVRYSANIGPYEQVPLAFKVGGYIHEIPQMKGADGRMRNLQEGDRVTRGMVLARVREHDYLEAVNQAKAAVAGAQAAREKASLDFERAKHLFETQSLTKPDYDAAKANFEASQARLEGVRAQLQLAEISLRDTALVSPLDGVVLKRQIEVGTLVGAGTVGFLLADTSSVKAAFGVPDLLMRRARLGIMLPVTTDVFGAREFPGRITAISPAADPSSRVFQVELTIRNPQELLKPGMIATVEVPDTDAPAPSRASVLVVPLNAIVKPESEEGFFVFVIEQQGEKRVARRREVQVGEVYGNMIAVRQGLKLGEQVVESGAALPRDGVAVRVVP